MKRSSHCPDNGNTSQNHIYDEYTLLQSQSSIQAVVKRLVHKVTHSLMRQHVQPVPRMGYVAGTLDAYFKQIMVFLANAEPY